jgi:hypothetical protein
MLPRNLMSVPLLADKTRTSPDSRTNFPERRFAVSFPEIGKSFKISVVTAIPLLVLLCEKEIV